MLQRALKAGAKTISTADFYGDGANETLIGVLQHCLPACLPELSLSCPGSPSCCLMRGVHCRESHHGHAPLQCGDL